jgi:hypothetical protein
MMNDKLHNVGIMNQSKIHHLSFIIKKSKIVNGSGKQREGNLKFKIIGFF